jgi:hypothetical protein
LRQITCEIFVKQGLEAALNIDRESFNTAHPHTVLLTHWIHSALRQLATAQKREAQQLRRDARFSMRHNAETRITRIIESANDLRTAGEGIVPNVRFTQSDEKSVLQDDGVTETFELDRILEEIPGTVRSTPKAESLKKLEAITKVLSVYGALEQLSPKEQDNLLGSILGILEAENLD